MAKFNVVRNPAQRLASRSDVTQNRAGGQAFKASPYMELYLRACSGFLSNNFYSTESQQLEGLRRAIFKTDRKYVLQLAEYVRTHMHLRTLSTILLAEASQEKFPEDQGKDVVSKSLLEEYAPKIIQRPDELTEVVSYLTNVLGDGNIKRMPNALKRGLVKAFKNFNEYSLAKYDRKGDITLRDVMRLIHPKPDTPEQGELFGRLISGDLATPDTWETYISANGSNAKTWNAIAPKMGFMALLRNLRNFEEKGATEALNIAIAKFRDKEAVAKSRQIPFRFLAALSEVTQSRTRDAIREAMDLSVANVPRIAQSLAVFVDTSGSMGSLISGKSKMRMLDVAACLGGMTAAISEADYAVYAFATHCHEVDVSRRDSILTNANKIIATSHQVGYGTLAYKGIEQLLLQKKKVDLVISFSDLQCYGDGASGPMAATWQAYRNKINPKALLVSVDLSGYGTLQFPEDDSNVIQIAGWSDKIFDVIAAFQNKEGVLKDIRV